MLLAGWVRRFGSRFPRCAASAQAGMTSVIRLRVPKIVVGSVLAAHAVFPVLLLFPPRRTAAATPDRDLKKGHTSNAERTTT